ncbi:hypothetical protein JQ596_00305 [Bradyrhizobium manausense]|uniref:hypothetical protein n=1 Tax=Bradyrhizobium TaxID=374 RepID=UPI001BA52634|nr:MULTISPECIES: hypothetical protein [Bradyrhizobium]MBR0823954.1 hypothetical protein [Bradyrhizobium manausense]UVO33589.1 hypothetical protein KUF59_27910 [Bradyrhizobium arachidis]
MPEPGLNDQTIAIAFSSEVDTGSRQENASKQESRAPFQSHWNGKGSSSTDTIGATLQPRPARPRRGERLDLFEVRRHLVAVRSSHSEDPALTRRINQILIRIACLQEVNDCRQDRRLRQALDQISRGSQAEH